MRLSTTAANRATARRSRTMIDDLAVRLAESSDARWRHWVAERLFGYSQWTCLPWPCRLRGHATPVRAGTWNEDAPGWEQEWWECPRCGEWLGHAE